MWFNDWVEVKKGKDDQQRPFLYLYLSFRNGADVLGPIRCPYPAGIPSGRFLINNGVLSGDEKQLFHTYPTVFLSRDKVRDLSEKLISGFGAEHVGLQDARGGVIQLKNIPHAAFESLDASQKDCFIPGHYTEQARWQLGWPLRKVSLDPVLEEMVPAFSELNQTYGVLYHIPRKKRTSLPEFRRAEDARRCLSAKLKAIDAGNEVGITEKTGELHLSLASLAGIRFLEDQLSEGDLMNLPWCFMDTEKKFFAYPEAQNCHVTLVFSQPGGGIKAEVHTTEYAGVQSIPAGVNGTHADFSVFYYRTDVEMVQGAAASIRREHSAVLCGHNIPYDAKEMRETREYSTKPGFPIGLESTDPRTAVSMDFFKRIDCRGTMVVDTCKLARILDPHIHAFDLETVAGIKKSITYQAFDKLARSSDPKDKLVQATYACHDVLALYHHVFHGPWKGRLSPVVDAARSFGVSISESSHGSSCAEKIRDRIFFVQQSTYRNARDQKAVLVKMKKRFQKKWPSIRDSLLTPLFSTAPPGRYEGVHRIYLPMEIALLPVTSVCVDQVDPLIGGYSRRAVRDQVSVCQYLRGMQAEQWLHWFYIKIHEGDALSAQAAFICSSEGEQGSLLDRMKIPRESFDSLRQEFWEEYARNKHAKQYARNLVLMAKAFGEGVLLSDARKVCDKTLHAMQASRRFSQRHFFSVDRFDHSAVRYASLVMEEISRNSPGNETTLIGRKGPWLYLSGALPASTHSAPFLPVDTVTLLKFTHRGDVRLVFKENGGYHGIDLDQKRPSSRTIFECRAIAGVIDALLAGDEGAALQVFEDHRTSLQKRQVELSDLLFSMPKEKFQFLGMDRRWGERVFSYAERDLGLRGFAPDMGFYMRRFEREVGRWCQVLRTGRLKTVP